MNLRIGSRGSQLALWQANHIAALLRGQGHSVEIEIIKTTGDRLQEISFAQVGAITGDKGIFTKEIEEALASGRVELAVHSLKDLPTELPELFALAATPPRADPRDVFVSAKYENLAALPPSARVGTSSQRRRAQLKALRPDIVAVEFRGNVDTRLRKLAEGQVDAILLAAAGLDRLEKNEWVRERLQPTEFCPAAGQGALGIETRKHDAATIAAVAFLDDPATRFAVTVERVALAALGGGCQVPIGVHCRRLPVFADPGDTKPLQVNAAANSLTCHVRVADANLLNSFPQSSLPSASPISRLGEKKMRNGWEWEIFAVVAAPATGKAVRIYHRLPHAGADPAELGRLIAEKLNEAGAGPLLAAAGDAQ
jgi:hydroxymethylbilane synthase